MITPNSAATPASAMNPIRVATETACPSNQISHTPPTSASGTIESIDAAGGKIEISHGPVATLEWPAMTMGFRATPEQISAVQVGQPVDFDFTVQGPEATLTNIEPAR